MNIHRSNPQELALTPGLQLSDIGKLVAKDFDDTEAETYDPSPHNINVDVGYKVGIDTVLGPAAADRYDGHQSRTAAQIVKAVEPDMSEDEIREVTPRIIRVKLDILLPEIGAVMADGSTWPRPTDGLIDYWKAIKQAKEYGHKIDTAILSAGHTEFITKFHELYDLPMPDILITDDVLAAFHLDGLSNDARAKPSPLLMTLAVVEWVSNYGYQPHVLDDNNQIPELLSRVVYVGDNAEKDGGLARNSGVDFIHIQKGQERCGWQSVLDWVGIEADITNISGALHA